MRKKLLIVGVLLGLPFQTHAWDGYDYAQGSYVEIDKGNLVRPGEDIEYYDYSSGEYRQATVEDVNSGLGTVELEVYDHDSGEYRVFEMDRD